MPTVVFDESDNFNDLEKVGFSLVGEGAFTVYDCARSAKLVAVLCSPGLRLHGYCTRCSLPDYARPKLCLLLLVGAR